MNPTPYRKPKRIQLQRTKGWRKPEGTVVVSRPTEWGNPFRVGDMVTPAHPGWGEVAPDHAEWRIGLGWQDFEVLDAAHAVELFRTYAKRHVNGGGWGYEHRAQRLLRGHDLACWCPLEDERGQRVPCHADVLLELANREATR